MRTLTVIAVFFAALAYVSFTRETKKPDSPKSSAPARSSRKVIAKRITTPIVIVKKPSSPSEWNTMPLGGYPPVMYKFEGLATCTGAPCTNAQVTIRVLAGKKVQTVAGVTDENGAYSIPVTVSVPLYAPVEWAIEAHTASYQQVELSGRRITTEKDTQDGRVTLEGALALL